MVGFQVEGIQFFYGRKQVYFCASKANRQPFVKILFDLVLNKVLCLWLVPPGPKFSDSLYQIGELQQW